MTSNMVITGHFGTLNQEEPTPLLRWKDGVLQQAWRITAWTAGMCSQQAKTEWRDVPVVVDAP